MNELIRNTCMHVNIFRFFQFFVLEAEKKIFLPNIQTFSSNQLQRRDVAEWLKTLGGSRIKCKFVSRNSRRNTVRREIYGKFMRNSPFTDLALGIWRLLAIFQPDGQENGKKCFQDFVIHTLRVQTKRASH